MFRREITETVDGQNRKKREKSIRSQGKKKNCCVISLSSSRLEFNTRPAKKACCGWGGRSRSTRSRGHHASGAFKRPVTFGDKWHLQWNIKDVFSGRLAKRSKDAEETFLLMPENRLHTKGRRVGIFPQTLTGPWILQFQSPSFKMLHTFCVCFYWMSIL